MPRARATRPALLIAAVLMAFTTDNLRAQTGPAVARWSTSLDGRASLAPEPTAQFQETPPVGDALIEIDEARTGQTLLGLGASLEPSTCSNLARLPADRRTRTLESLVSPEHGIGMNLMRLCIGSPDFTGDPWYSYLDLPPGETDPELKRFSIEKDRAYLLPAIREALRINPDLLFFASPWSPPGWMKSTGTMIGGSLKREWYAAYAQYFVRFIRAYEAEGVPIYAVTVQNEPGVDRAQAKDPKWHYPSCHWTGEQERDFIRDHLGPAFRQAGLKTRIWCYDHNYNLESKGDDAGLPHPRAILSDPGAAAWVQGVGFHGYVGEPSGMSVFHREFPRVPIHFTEGSVFGIDGARDLIERLRHQASSYNAWVMMLDEQGRPNNGPFPATHAILKLHSDTLRVEPLFEYFAYGQFMKFIRRGAVRLESSEGDRSLRNVVFRNPDGTLVLVAANTEARAKAVVVRWRGRGAQIPMDAKSVTTLRWNAVSP
ncbi:MAG: hypothetical protein IT580_11525 [Verrucomicrobiales bacterium]|nr:hypothetical protein [Verrucomicrobiales bacterium]